MGGYTEKKPAGSHLNIPESSESHFWFSLHLLNRVLSWFKEEIFFFFHCPRLFILCHFALQGNPGFPGAPAMGVTMSGLQPFLCHTALPTVVPVDQGPRDASHWSVGWTKRLYPWPSNQPCLLLPCSISFFLPLCHSCPLAPQRSTRIKPLPCSSLCSGLVPLLMLLWFLLKRHCWCLFFWLFALFSSGNRFLQHPVHVLPNARAAFRINFGSGHLCALHSISARAVEAAGSCNEGWDPPPGHIDASWRMLEWARVP